MLGYDPRKDQELTDQYAFDFSDDARSMSISELGNDLADFIYSVSDGITFGNLMEKIANQTPASSTIVQDALSVLRSEKDIQIITPAKNERRSVRQISKDDLLKRNANYKFKF